jgi:hypothetical protein
MGSNKLGRITVAAKIEIIDNLVLVRAGIIPPYQARSIDVDDALVDTGGTMLTIPERMIEP